MKNISLLLVLLTACILFSSCEVADEQSSYPNIFIVKEKTDGFMSVEDIRNIKNGRKSDFLNKLIADGEKDLELPYLDPTVDFEGRSPVHLKHANVSYDMAIGIKDRMSRSALLYLKTGNDKYKKLVMDQIEALYDTTLWPLWCDKAHINDPPYVDIRTYRISMWVALSYNWLHEYLTEEEKKFIIEGLDRRAIQPFWEKIAQRPGWYKHRHNWFTNMYGGMGITAMALGKAHPDTQALLDTIVPAMIDFNKVFGPMGEFNEPPGYSGAVRFSVEFAEAYRYYTQNRVNLLNQKPFPEICYWMLYHTLPPGRLAGFGDTSVKSPPGGSEVMAAVANANGDGVLQWYYQQYFNEIKSPVELLWYNPDLDPVDPEGRLPLGKAYNAYGASLISRTSWSPISATSIVYGKAGRETNHDDNDVGQLLIDGFGHRLIIDSGKPNPIYPKDYFKDSIQYNYYSRSSTGHNVLVIDDKEMLSEPNSEARGQTVHSWFDDSIGSSWEIDLSAVYPNAKSVTRKVAHLYPGIVVVHDLAVLPEKKTIDLRWHAISDPKLGKSGKFQIRYQDAAISSKIVELNGNSLNISVGHHEYKAPYNLTRQGDPLEQDREAFVKISTKAKSFSALTLFAVRENENELSAWVDTEKGWSIVVKGVEYAIDRKGDGFRIYSTNSPDSGIDLE